MFKVSPRRVSATLCLVFLSFVPLASLAQETTQAPAQETAPQDDSAPMLDLTNQPTISSSASLASPKPSTRPSTRPSTQPSPSGSPKTMATPQRSSSPGVQSTNRPLRSTPAAPSTNPTAPQETVQNQETTASEGMENTEKTENAESTSSGAAIPPDPNVLDNAIHTPIYTRPMGKEPAPLDTPSEMPENERSPYSILAIVLWICFIVAAAATGYFLYVRFSDKD
jgi:hypothetical protein